MATTNDDAPPFRLSPDPVSRVEARDFKGFKQYRDSPRSPWCFYITGFDCRHSGAANRCHVLRTDGTTACVPIDADNRILIDGRRYGQRRWNH